MVGVCKWDFGTIGLLEFGIGNTGVCGTEPPSVPNDPTTVNAVAGDGSVTISWQAPTNGKAVTYYKIEKSTDNGNCFSTIDGNLPADTLSYTDNNAQNGTSHIYKVSAGNDVGLSNGVNSNTVTPKAIKVTVVPGAPQNVSATAGDSTVTVNWTAPITGDTVAYYKLEKAVNGAALSLVKDKIPSATLQYIDTTAQNGASHVYRVSAGNAIGLGVAVVSISVTPKAGIPASAFVELMSQSPQTGNQFGQKMAFSPDGNTLVIGEPYGDPTSAIDAGTAQVFTKSNGNWTQTQTLSAQTPRTNEGYGGSVAISPDGLVLAVGSLLKGAVELYTKSGNHWVYAQSLIANGLTSSRFGTSVAFHPNSNLLAIGVLDANPNGVSNAGTVQLFIKSGTTWTFAQELTALVPAAGNDFGGE